MKFHFNLTNPTTSPPPVSFLYKLNINKTKMLVEGWWRVWAKGGGLQNDELYEWKVSLYIDCLLLKISKVIKGFCALVEGLPAYHNGQWWRVGFGQSIFKFQSVRSVVEGLVSPFSSFSQSGQWWRVWTGQSGQSVQSGQWWRVWSGQSGQSVQSGQSRWVWSVSFQV